MFDYRELNDVQERPLHSISFDTRWDMSEEVQDIPEDLDDASAEAYLDVQLEAQDIPDDIPEDAEEFSSDGYPELASEMDEVQDIPDDLADDEPDYWEMAAPTPVSEMHETDKIGGDIEDVPGSQLAKDADVEVPGSQLDTGEDVDMPGQQFKNEEQDEGNDCRDIGEIMEAFQKDNWEGLSDDARKEAVNELGDYVAQDLGIEEKPKIEFYNNEDPGDFGSYDGESNTIRINEYTMDNAEETADTISHESRHCYQHECAENPKTEQDYAFLENFQNYIRPEDDFEGYQDQIVEADARDYAQAYRDMIK